jgi:hypothetical protein
VIKPTAMTDAKIRNQIGQPAASTIANTGILQICLNYEPYLPDEGAGSESATVACRGRLSKISKTLLQQS